MEVSIPSTLIHWFTVFFRCSSSSLVFWQQWGHEFLGGLEPWGALCEAKQRGAPLVSFRLKTDREDGDMLEFSRHGDMVGVFYHQLWWYGWDLVGFSGI